MTFWRKKRGSTVDFKTGSSDSLFKQEKYEYLLEKLEAYIDESTSFSEITLTMSPFQDRNQLNNIKITLTDKVYCLPIQ